MFLLLTIFFLTWSLYFTIKGNPFIETNKRAGQFLIDLFRAKNRYEKDKLYSEYADVLGLGIIAILLYIINIIYFAHAFDIDKVITLGAITLYIIQLIVAKSGSIKSEDDVIKMQYRMATLKKRTIWGTTRGIIWVAYYGYILYLLVMA